MKSDIPKKESKRAKIHKSDESDDDLNTREAALNNYVNKCEQQVCIFVSFFSKLVWFSI